MKHTKIRNRFITMLIAIFVGIVMLGGVVFASLPSFVDDSQITFADDSGETKPDHTYELKSISVAKKADWVFTESTPVDMVYKMVTVTVTYTNVQMSPQVDESFDLMLSGATSPTNTTFTKTEAGAYITTEGGETVTFSEYSASTSQATFKVTIELRKGATLKAGATDTDKTISATINCTPGNRVQNGIYAEVKESAPSVTSGTLVENALFQYLNVYPTYNDGTKDAQPDTMAASYALSGDFFPEELTSACFVDGYTYSKGIKVTKTDAEPNYETTAIWKNIKFEDPYELPKSITTTGGGLPQQVARSELNLDGLTLSLDFGSDSTGWWQTVVVPLSAFVNYLEKEYTTSSGEHPKALTRDVISVKLTVTYPKDLDGRKTVTTPFKVQVNPRPLHIPLAPKQESVAYNEGASIDFGNWDYNALYQATEEFPAPAITITAEDNYKITVPDLTKDPADGALTVEFDQAGLYYTLNIKLDPKGDFNWENPPIGDPLSKPVGAEDFVLQFSIQVDKGTLDLKLDGIESSMVYGTQNGNGTLSAKILNTDPEVSLTGKWAGGFESAIPTEWPKDELNVWKYHLEYYNSQSAAEAAQTAYKAEAAKKTGQTMPTPAGRVTLPTKPASGLKLDRPKDADTYYVIAVSHENGGYFAAVSNVVTFTITPYEIKTQVKGKEFARKTYSLNDFLTANDDDGNPLNNFKYGDKAENILDITGDSKYTTANKYTVKVTVKTTDNYSKNYTLQGGSGTPSSKTLEFSITTSKESDFAFTAAGWTFNEADAKPTITITQHSDTYYPSYTTYGNASPTLADLEKDFDIVYYTYTDGKRGATPITTATYATFQQWPAGDYLAVLTAKAETRSQDYLNRDVSTLENPQKAEGVTVSYLLPEHEWKFSVAASAIKVPYLEEATKWAFLNIDAGSIGNELGTYKASAYKYEFKNWITNNIAANGDTIITVTIKYDLYTSGSSTDYATVNGKDISIKNAGKYVITIELNPNYKWDTDGLPEKMVSLSPTTREYKFVGYISRQTIGIVSNDNIGKDDPLKNDVFNGLSRTKTITGWNNDGLKITSVRIGALASGHTPISGGIAWYGGDQVDGVTLSYGQFAVLNAGEYTVDVDIADPINYMWDDSTIIQRPLTYRLEQATLRVKWEGKDGTLVTSGDHPSYGFNGFNGEQQTTPTATLYLQGGLNKDEGKIQIDGYKYWAYNDGQPFTQPIAKNQVNAKGYYYIAVNSFSDKDAGDPAAANYKVLPPDELVGTLFEITSYKLKKPTFNADKNTVVYKGTAYDLTTFISDYETDKDFNVGGQHRITASVVGDEAKEAKNVGTYTIRITITDPNFAWAADVEYYEFPLEITPLPVEIIWTVDEVTYAPNGGTPNAQYKITNIAPAEADDANKDKLSLELGYKKGDKVLSLASMNAGQYTVYAAKLTSTDESHTNYTLEGTQNPINHDFTIKKMWVDRFAVAENEKEVNNFNGVSGHLPISVLTNFVNADVQILVTGRVPGGSNGWFTDTSIGDVTLTGLPTLKFKEGASKFEYERAGIYSFIVTLDPTNYYWKETPNEKDFNNSHVNTAGRYEYRLDDAFTVNPRLLTAPIMGYYESDSENGGQKLISQRAQEFNKKPPESLEIKLLGRIEDSTLGNVEYNVQFGVAGKDSELQNKWIGFNETRTEGVQGFYFALLTLKDVSADMLLNYKWKANSLDPNSLGEGSNYLTEHRDEFVYIEKNGTATVTVKLYYAITRSQLPITLKVKNYEFGDNGMVDGKPATASFDPNAVLTSEGTVYLYADKSETLDLVSGEHAPKLLEGWQFLDKDGQQILNLDTENGLPWNAGEYILSGKMRFGEGALYEDLPVEVRFTVAKRTISFTWDDLTPEYNHDFHMASARVTTEIYRMKKNSTDYDTENNIAGGLSLNVLWKDHDEQQPINAGKYTVTIDNTIVGNDGNFQLPADLTNTLNILPKSVKIGGKALTTKHVYGDDIRFDLNEDESEIYYQFLDGTSFCDDGAETNLFVEVFKSDRKTLYSRYDDADDVYYIIARWKATNLVHCTNYEVEFDKNATFTVIKRELTVEWLTAGSVYGMMGSAIDLYEYLNVTFCNGRGGVDDAYAGREKNLVIELTPTYALNEVPDADTYLVTPKMKDTTNWDITFTNKDNWEYTITNETIKATFKTNEGLTYQAKNLTVIENTYHNILEDKNKATWQYGLVQEGESVDKVTKWLPMTSAHSVELFNAGTYYVFIKITAEKNYNEFVSESAFKVVIARAELKVKFDFTIKYGEDNPASREHLFGTEAVRGGKGWKVTGFLGGDEARFKDSGNNFYELQGDGKYTITDFPTTWDWNHATALQTYTITYSGEALSCINYYFKAEQGTLTIAKITIKVTGKTVDVVYNTPYDEFPPYQEEDLTAEGTDAGKGYTVEHPLSTYDTTGTTKYVTDNDHYNDLITVSSEAFKAKGSMPTTANVGDYKLLIEKYKTLTSTIYDVQIIDNGKVNVTAASLPNYQIEGYEKAFDELYHGLFVDGTSTVNTDGSWNKKAFEATSDGTEVTTEFWRRGSAYSGEITDSVLEGWSADKITDKDGPSYIDVGTHYIVYRISAGTNYTVIRGTATIKITQAENKLKENTDFRFNDDDAKVYSGSGYTFKDATEAAWIYGYGVDGGFDVKGRHVITDPVALYHRASATDTLQLKYQLFYSANGEGLGTQISKDSDDYANATALFKELFKNTGVFNAGYYRLEVSMSVDGVTGTPNFTFTTLKYFFRVEKRDLHVKVADTSTVYGEAAPAFTPAHTGRVPNSSSSNEPDSIEMALSADFKKAAATPNFITEYTQGKFVEGGTKDPTEKGRYYIRVDDNRVAYDGALNYFVTYDDAWLTVKKRSVTITIEDKTSIYNDKTSIQELTFKVTVTGDATSSDRTYDLYKDQLEGGKTSKIYTNTNQTLLTLYTLALVNEAGEGEDPDWNTNHVYYNENGVITGYTIYAVFNGNNKTNYAITFDGCTTAEKGSGVTASGQEPIGVNSTDTTNNAGLYKIDRAHVDLDIRGVHHYNGDKEVSSNYYSGAENFFKAYLKDPASTPIDFTYLRSEDGKEFGTYVSMNGKKPVDVGWYRAEGTSTSKDYYNGSMSATFEIKPAEVELVAEVATVQYGTALSGNINEDKKLGGIEDKGLFTGFRYEVKPKYDILEKEISAYRNMDSGLVTYITLNYTASTPVPQDPTKANSWIEPSCKNTANITFIPAAAKLTILQREISLKLVGWDVDNNGDESLHNPYASSTYTGNQGDLQKALENSFREHISKFVYAPPEQDTFGASGDKFESFNFDLKLDKEAKDVDTYSITFTWGNDNYNVADLNECKPKFAVLPAPLTLYANDSAGKDAARPYSIVYGETISRIVSSGYETPSEIPGVARYDKTLRFAVSGMVLDEALTDYLESGDVQFSITLKDDPNKTAYKEWKSTVDQTYIVSIDPVERPFTNYKITSYITAELTISQRTITAEVENQDQVFSFGGATDYKGGASGMNHVATIAFKDGHITKQDSNVNTYYRPDFSLKYAPYTTGTKTYVDAAPMTAGEYYVKVTLDSGSNYKFAEGNSCEVYYRIIPMTVSDRDLTWATSPIQLTKDTTGGIVTNHIDKYQSGYLKVEKFYFIPNDGADTELSMGNGDGQYYFDEYGRLCIKLDSTKQIYGRYTVRIELQSSAKTNIQLISGSENVDFILATFIVTTDVVTMEVSFGDFEYGSTPDIQKLLTVMINGKKTENVLLTYAAIDPEHEAKAKDLYDTSSSNKGLTGTDITGLKYGVLSISPNFTVGYYLLSVYSAQWTTTRYYVFRVNEKEITAPEIAEEKLTTFYNGEYQSISVDYNFNEITPSFSGNMVITGGTVTFTVLDVNTYTIQFVLFDTANTKWKTTLPEDGGSALPKGARVEEDGITLTYTWTVNKDTAENGSAVITVPSLVDNMIYGDDYKGTIRPKSGYNSTMKLYYLPRTEGEEAPSAGEWKLYYDSDRKSYERLNVGLYWIKVVLLETSNYGEKVAYGKFQLSPKTIQASISGTITYGESIYGEDGTSPKFKPVVTGILDGDPLETLNGYSYSLYEAYSQYLTEAGHLMAGKEYYIILATNEQGVIGITVGDKGNYIINAVKGRLIVNKRSVTVNITGTSGDYSVDPMYALAELKYDIDAKTPLAPGETKEVLEIEFYTDATARSNVGGVYWITITDWARDNYNISYQRASYTVNPLEVEITLDPQQNIIYKPGVKVVGATFDAEDLKISNPHADKNKIIENLRDALKLRYTGTSYAGVFYDSNEHGGEAPENAGVYTAQVTGAGSNYKMIGAPSVEFTIQKQTVEYSKLEIKSQIYTGALLAPELGVIEGASNSILSLVKATLVSYKTAGTYQIVVTLRDADNYQWDNTQDAFVTVPFEIIKANDSLVDGLITINGWQYGCYSAENNSPFAQAVSGSAVTYEYSTDGETFTNIVPDTGSVGVYYVRVVVADSENYFGFTSDPVAFHITKYYLAVPEIIESDGTFTGGELSALISNYDARYMAVMNESEARTFVGATNITAVAVNAGVYRIYISINDFTNCGWLDNAGDNAGVLTLTWTIAKKKVALPTTGKSNFVVNGNEIVYIPDGFDESIMDIVDNVQSYGGNFTAIVTLKDTANYEWADGSLRVELKWHVTGANTLLAIILSVLAACVVAGIVGIITQTALDKRRKRTEAAALAEIENKDLAEGEAAADGANSESDGTGEEGDTSEETAEETSEETAEETADDTAEETPKETAEETPQEQTSGSTSKSKSGKGGKKA